MSEKSELPESQTYFTPKDLPQELQQLLIVDDDPVILDLLSEFFSRLGYQYYSAGDGLEAMSLLEQHLITIVITDLLMPRMDGMELIREIKKLWPEIDIIAITGYSRDFNYSDVIRAGASDFIRKPFNLDELKAKLDRIIRERGYRALLKRLSIRDILTDLYNRRFLDIKLEKEAQRATRQNYPLFLIMLDLDNFKELNDALGHQAGDEVLRRLAGVLNDSVRSNVDIPFRYGGDEFAVMIPHASTEQVKQIAERIRRNYLNEQDVGKTSLSLGISRFRRTNKGLREDINELIYKADSSMYIAKRAGGNRVIFQEETKKE
ncbi:MAG: diguanylate cyclase [Deltaproteobacteria bacterium]|nr:diguanylate cyclase [Deltaproteobacteria bacterium]MBW1966694.1 diguanylate cyclase [Deltaproteobacteria bacterium]MBW2098724.1 diguanylate cyclase [Deltaproteobacteria bacterium]